MSTAISSDEDDDYNLAMGIQLSLADFEKEPKTNSNSVPTYKAYSGSHKEISRHISLENLNALAEASSKRLIMKCAFTAQSAQTAQLHPYIHVFQKCNQQNLKNQSVTSGRHWLNCIEHKLLNVHGEFLCKYVIIFL